MAAEERTRYLGAKPTTTEGLRTVLFSTGEGIPESVDWRSAGAVNAIQNQASCGSCWAFSSVAALEGAHFVATGELLKFSEQELVDCSTEEGNAGCNGGIMEGSFEYWQTHFAVLESDYGYKGRDGSCKYDSSTKTKVETTGYTEVTRQSASSMKAALAQQPVSVAIQANQLGFQFYSGGVFDNTNCGTDLDHAVNLVGYGTENGQEYFILRNSWGTSWGEAGYMKMANTGDGDGICGVLLNGVYPTSN